MRTNTASDLEPTTGELMRAARKDTRLVLRHAPLMATLAIVTLMSVILLSALIAGGGKTLETYRSETPTGQDVAAWRERVRQADPGLTNEERREWANESRSFAENAASHSTGSARVAWEEAARLAGVYALDGTASSTLRAHADTLAALSSGLDVRPDVPGGETVVHDQPAEDAEAGSQVAPTTVMTDQDATGVGQAAKGS